MFIIQPDDIFLYNIKIPKIVSLLFYHAFMYFFKIYNKDIIKEN